MKLRGFPDEVVRKIGPAKVFQIDRPELFPESLLPGEGCSLFIVPEELLAFLLAIGSPDDILLEKCLLIFPVCDRLTVFRLLELLEVFVQINRHPSAPSPSPG